MELLRSQHNLTRPKAEHALQVQQAMPMRRLQLKGRARWMSQLTKAKHTLYLTHSTTPPATQPSSTTSTSSSTTPADFETPLSLGHGADLRIRAPGSDDGGLSAQTTLPQLVFFQCPRCPHKLPGAKAAFDLGQLDRRIWCNQCARSLFVRTWQCQCELPWHTCPTHKGEPQRLRDRHGQPTSNSSTRAPAPTRPKRSLGQGRDTVIQQWLDNPAPKRARPSPAEVELGAAPAPGIKHHLLGPKLRAKFPRLCSSAAQPTPSSPQTSPPPPPVV